MTAPVIILFPYRRLPATGSRIPSISTAGPKIKLVTKQSVASNKSGNIKIPNQPT
jgi:hypothetical protein